MFTQSEELHTGNFLVAAKAVKSSGDTEGSKCEQNACKIYQQLLKQHKTIPASSSIVENVVLKENSTGHFI